MDILQQQQPPLLTQPVPPPQAVAGPLPAGANLNPHANQPLPNPDGINK